MISIKEYKNIVWEAALEFTFSFGKVKFKDNTTYFSKNGCAKFDIIDIKIWNRIRDSKELYMENRSSDAWVYHYDVDEISINGNRVTIKFNSKTSLSLKEYRTKIIENSIS